MNLNPKIVLDTLFDFVSSSVSIESKCIENKNQKSLEQAVFK